MVSELQAESVMLCTDVAIHITSNRTSRARNMAIDWPAVERDYVAGILSLRALGEKHHCSHSAIANFASRHGWIRTRPTAHLG